MNWPMTSGTLWMRLISSCARTSSRFRLLRGVRSVHGADGCHGKTHLCSSLMYSSCSWMYLCKCQRRGPREARGATVVLQLPLQLLERRVVVAAVCRQALEAVDCGNRRRGRLLVRRHVVGRVLDCNVAHLDATPVAWLPLCLRSVCCVVDSAMRLAMQLAMR